MAIRRASQIVLALESQQAYLVKKPEDANADERAQELSQDYCQDSHPLALFQRELGILRLVAQATSPSDEKVILGLDTRRPSEGCRQDRGEQKKGR